MNKLFMLIKEHLQKNDALVLVTVTESSGSVPRGKGARMLVGKDEDAAPIRLWGSIGGGITEHLAIEEAGALLWCGIEAQCCYIAPNENEVNKKNESQYCQIAPNETIINSPALTGRGIKLSPRIKNYSFFSLKTKPFL